MSLPEGSEPSPQLLASAHCHASTCAPRPRPADPFPSGRRTSSRPADDAAPGRLWTPTSAGTSGPRRRGGPDASAARRRRSARTTATPRSRARSLSARRPPRSPPGWRRCVLPAASTAAIRPDCPTGTPPGAWLRPRRSCRPLTAGQRRDPPGRPYSSTSKCMCRYETVPAIAASTATHPMVVRRIHSSARAVMLRSQRENPRTAHRRRRLVQHAPRTHWGSSP
jgi:hypothetical protein